MLCLPELFIQRKGNITLHYHRNHFCCFKSAYHLPMFPSSLISCDARAARFCPSYTGSQQQHRSQGSCWIRHQSVTVKGGKNSENRSVAAAFHSAGTRGSCELPGLAAVAPGCFCSWLERKQAFPAELARIKRNRGVIQGLVALRSRHLSTAEEFLPPHLPMQSLLLSS